ncbi:MAG: ATP-binding protein [Candidatus Paceibacterota bacterium]
MNDPKHTTPPWYVLTGGPCAGKTTLIFELEKRGHLVVAEGARLIIDEKLAAGETIEQIVTDPDWLGSVVRRVRDMHLEVPKEEQYFFDRGVPDSIAYYTINNKEVDDELRDAMDRVKYRKVFLLDLIDFVNDEARSETPEQAMILHGLIREAYADQGYEIVEVPVLPVPERADFILKNL